MKDLTDSIEINASSKDIYKMLVEVFSSEEGYRNWHPDHRVCSWVNGKPFEEGSVLYAEEYIHGKMHKLKFTMTGIKKNQSIEYMVSFPMSLIITRGSLSIIQNKESCTFRATLTCRLGGILEKIAKRRMEGLKSHMKEEGERLKEIVESKAQG